MMRKVTALVLALVLVGLLAGTAMAGREWIIDGALGYAAAATE